MRHITEQNIISNHIIYQLSPLKEYGRPTGPCYGINCDCTSGALKAVPD